MTDNLLCLCLHQALNKYLNLQPNWQLMPNKILLECSANVHSEHQPCNHKHTFEEFDQSILNSVIKVVKQEALSHVSNAYETV